MCKGVIAKATNTICEASNNPASSFKQAAGLRSDVNHMQIAHAAPDALPVQINWYPKQNPYVRLLAGYRR